MWTRRELKDKAKVSFKANYWKAVLIALLIAAIGGSMSGFSSGGGSYEPIALASLSNADSTSSQLDGYDGNAEYYDYLDPYYDEWGDYYYEFEDEYGYDDRYGYSDDEDIPVAAAVLAGFGILFIFLIVLAVVLALDVLVFNPLLVGARRFFVRNLNKKAEAKEAAYAFDSGNYIEIVKTMFFRDLFVFLWSLLFIVPGIVKSYEYRMIPYLLAEDPSLTKDAAFAESKRMMDGQKWDTFVLDLSFLGWNILAACTLGILGIFYVAPYQAQTNAALYEKLRYGQPGPTQPIGAGAGQPPMPPMPNEPAQVFASTGYSVGAAAASAAVAATNAQESTTQPEATQTATAETAAEVAAPAGNTAQQAYWRGQSPAAPMAARTASQPPIAPYAAIAANPYPQTAPVTASAQVQGSAPTAPYASSPTAPQNDGGSPEQAGADSTSGTEGEPGETTQPSEGDVAPQAEQA